MRKFKLWLSILCSIFILPTHAQNTQQCVAFAKQMQKEGHFDEAIRTYKRVLFFASPDSVANYYLHIADCYNALNERSQAVHYYDLSLAQQPHDSIKEELYYRKVQANLKEGEVGLAMDDLETISQTVVHGNHDRLAFHKGVAYFMLHEMDSAEVYFLNIQTLTSIQRQSLKQLFAKAKAEERLKPTHVQNLSLIWPGLGQLYVHEYSQAINSFLLVGSLVVMGVYVATTYTVLDAMLGIWPWFQRYYIGGYRKTEHLAEKYRNDKLRKLYGLILKEVKQVP